KEEKLKEAYNVIQLTDKLTSWYKMEYPGLSTVHVIEISDPVNPDGPVNTKLLRIQDSQNKTLGFVREITTSTGCNDGCYPIILTLFCDPSGEYLRLKSETGLTKKNHEPMSAEDLFKLDLVIRTNPPEFKKIKHPKDMVDALTGETKPKFVGKVVPMAAYSSYRISMYYQHTKKEILKVNLSSLGK
ncbi:hypothetical protein N9N67_11985, partial [Bacteriovoracaceae bacterium]|nr:hypothetical protein [Bacteriovoracaceae bacterium]